MADTAASRRRAPKPPERTAMTDEEKKARAEERKAEIASGAAFVRLGTKRARVALKAIGLLGNLAKYPHTPEQATKIVTALKEAVTKLEAGFSGSKSADEGFSL